MITTTLMNFNIPNQVKNDFHMVCKVNQTSMTSELVRFINKYISEEVQKFKQIKVDRKEINEFERRLSSVPLIQQPHNQQSTWGSEPRWEDSH